MSEYINSNGLNIILFENFHFEFSIRYYSTASVADKVYIIGGYPSSNNKRIAEYADGQWREYGSLSTGRYVHSSITHKSETMIIGAFGSSSLV